MVQFKHQPIYVISGWGFSANILAQSAMMAMPAIGLDYASHHELTLEAIATQLASRIAKPATIVAWSLGGLFAIKIAALFPEKVTKLVLLASQPKLIADNTEVGIAPEVMQRFIHLAKKDITLLKRLFIGLVHYPCRNQMARRLLTDNFRTDSKVLIAFLHIMLTSNLQDDYRTLKMPVHHIVGGKDAVLPQDGNHLQKLNAHVHVHTIKEAGHAGFLTYPQLYRDILNE